jgi:hypothetical protein
VQVWREAEVLFDERERAALAWAETVTRVAETAIPEVDYQSARTVFNEKELVDLNNRYWSHEYVQPNGHRLSETTSGIACASAEC